MAKYLSLSLLSITLLFTACTDKEKEKSLTDTSMKCGAGKCGASMADGSALLVKKKMNILDQMKEEDKRRACVLKSKTSKALYNCVRDPKTGRLSIQNKSKAFKELSKKELNISKCESAKCSGAVK